MMLFTWLLLDHEVVDLHAYDPEGTVINYSLNTSQVPFGIISDTGRVYVNGALDREVSYMWLCTNK